MSGLVGEVEGAIGGIINGTLAGVAVGRARQDAAQARAAAHRAAVALEIGKVTEQQLIDHIAKLEARLADVLDEKAMLRAELDKLHGHVRMLEGTADLEELLA